MRKSALGQIRSERVRPEGDRGLRADDGLGR